MAGGQIRTPRSRPMSRHGHFIRPPLVRSRAVPHRQIGAVRHFRENSMYSLSISTFWLKTALEM